MGTEAAKNNAQVHATTAMADSATKRVAAGIKVDVLQEKLGDRLL
jgi:hypothetical protein